MDAAGWLAGYQHRVGEIERRAARLQATLDAVAATETSRDGAVTVSVSPAGAVRALSLGSGAEELTRAELAATILTTARKAREAAAREAVQAVTPLLGEDSATVGFLRSQLQTAANPRETP